MVARTLILAALSLPALAQEPSELVGMQKAYGWRTIATIVSATASGDQTTADAHSQLKELGLDRLSMPVTGGRAGLSLTGCGWNDAVVCRLDLPPATPAPEALACTRRGQHLLDVRLQLTVATPATQQAAGEAWVEDLLPCWRAGGTQVALIPAPQVPTDGLTIEASGPAAVEAIELVQAHFSVLRACGSGRLVWHTDPDGRPDVVKVAAPDDSAVQPATGCVQDVLARVRLAGAVELSAPLGE